MAIFKELKKLKHILKSFVNQSQHTSFKNNYFKENYTETKKLIILFVPAGTDKINGGILSFCTIYNVMKELKYVHKCDVLASFLPEKIETDYKYRKFSNDMIIFTFKEVKKYFPALDYLEFHIPDVMVAEFDKENKKMNGFFEWTSTIKKVHVNILNQNDLLMPKPEKVAELKILFPEITMTTAHERYTTIEKRAVYKMPLHLFSAWLTPTPYKIRTFEEKENLVIYSPDDIETFSNSCGLTKVDIIKNLQSKLPHYEFLEIKNMKYDVYKEYASKAKFAITFGEGLDGYLIETIFSGGISFGVYNKVFFTDDYKNLPSIYHSFDALNEKIVEDITYYDKMEQYNSYHQQLYAVVSKSNSYDKLKKNITQFYLKNFDFK